MGRYEYGYETQIREEEEKEEEEEGRRKTQLRMKKERKRVRGVNHEPYAGGNNTPFEYGNRRRGYILDITKELPYFSHEVGEGMTVLIRVQALSFVYFTSSPVIPSIPTSSLHPYA